MSKRGRPIGIPKTGGRQPGSGNKVTTELKHWITELIEDNKPQFVENLKKLEPEKHVQIMERLMAYIVPKPQNIDLQIEYRLLEQLLERTPEQYIEKLYTKIIHLNALNNDKD
jgi:hypothetical protein